MLRMKAKTPGAAKTERLPPALLGPPGTSCPRNSIERGCAAGRAGPGSVALLEARLVEVVPRWQPRAEPVWKSMGPTCSGGRSRRLGDATHVSGRCCVQPGSNNIRCVVIRHFVYAVSIKARTPSAVDVVCHGVKSMSATSTFTNAKHSPFTSCSLVFCLYS